MKFWAGNLFSWGLKNYLLNTYSKYFKTIKAHQTVAPFLKVFRSRFAVMWCLFLAEDEDGDEEQGEEDSSSAQGTSGNKGKVGKIIYTNRNVVIFFREYFYGISQRWGRIFT